MKLTRQDFARACSMAKQLGGLHFGEGKVALLHGRLSKRAIQEDFSSICDYLEHVDNSGYGSTESVHFLNALTTNKTAFFREPHHFDYLVSTVAPRYLARFRRGLEHGPLRVWSAAASRGHEVYSAAMVLADALDMDEARATLLATDIDTETLEIAKKATYRASDMDGLPVELRRRRFLRGVDKADGHWRLRSEIRSMVQFSRMNLTDASLPIGSRFHVVFCRNVLFYFDVPTQRRLVQNLTKHLLPGGSLIMGHSENLEVLTAELAQVESTVYQRAHEATETSGIQPRGTRTLLSPSSRTLIVGDYVARADCTTLSTVLGSCVAVCLYDDVAGCGGMCHFALPEGPAGGAASARYGDVAIPKLIRELQALGARRARLKAKLFGAGGALCEPGGPADLNREFTRAFLRAQGIPVVAERLGLRSSIEAHLTCATGAVRVRATEAEKEGGA
ncbi:MAG: hypothetical protein GY811_25065 [Myxococcales bacterium]|nr:hypothetical protein [Myxococcales bacterium]